MTSPRTGRAYLDAVLERPGAVLAMAHRGGAGHPDLTGLENTHAAFAHAVALGYDYLETDVHATADGVLMAFHDDVLDRVTDQTGSVATSTYDALRHARIGGREGIPTLDSLLEAFPTAKFNIDLKSAGAVRALADFLAARQAYDRVMVGSFSRSRLREFRRLTAGKVATSATPPEVAAFLLAPDARTAARAASEVDAFQVPHRRAGLVVTTARLVRRAHALRKHVHVWTIDEPEEIRTLLARDVDGLVTDRTDVLKTVLLEDGRWRESPR